MIRAVLFDMDGLLVDTENLDIGVASDICKALGLNLTIREKHSSIGVTRRKFYEDLFRKRKVEIEIDEILKKHSKVYEELLEIELRHFSGAKILPMVGTPFFRHFFLTCDVPD